MFNVQTQNSGICLLNCCFQLCSIVLIINSTNCLISKALLKLHRLDDHSESVTGSAVLQWPKTSKVGFHWTCPHIWLSDVNHRRSSLSI